MDDFDDLAVGIVRAHLDCLEFANSRDLDLETVSKLVEVFEGPYGCDPSHNLNIIPAIIYSDDLQRILEASHLSRSQIESSLRRKSFRPQIQTSNIRIQCLQGQHRVEAGKRFLPQSEYWWTVKLYCFESTNYQFAGLALKEGERFSYETRFSDGEIYYKVRYYEERGQDDWVKEWKLRLGNSKKRDLTWLLEMPGYTSRLDNIVRFPGLRNGLELGNVRRHLALRCDGEIQMYLEHISSTWDTILLGNCSLRKHVDVETVNLLQARFPLASQFDRHFIIRAMEKGQLFPGINDSQTRDQIQHAILQLRIIIPTVKTLHENCKLLEIGVKIIRSHLLPDRSGSLFESLRDIWRPPSTSLLEVYEGVFEPVRLLDPEENAHFAYLQLLLAAFRQFTNLSDITPRREVRHQRIHASVQSNYQRLFATRAKLLGFSNGRILAMSCENSIGLPSTPELLSCPSRKPEDEVKRRYGRPYGMAYNEIQNELFFPEIEAESMQTVSATAMSIQLDFVKAFFKPVGGYELIANQPRVSLVAIQRNHEIHTLPFSLNEGRVQVDSVHDMSEFQGRRGQRQHGDESYEGALESNNLRTSVSPFVQSLEICYQNSPTVSNQIITQFEEITNTHILNTTARDETSPVSTTTVSPISASGYIPSPPGTIIQHTDSPRLNVLTVLMSSAMIEDRQIIHSLPSPHVQEDEAWESDKSTVVGEETDNEPKKQLHRIGASSFNSSRNIKKGAGFSRLKRGISRKRDKWQKRSLHTAPIDVPPKRLSSKKVSKLRLDLETQREALTLQGSRSYVQPKNKNATRTAAMQSLRSHVLPELTGSRVHVGQAIFQGHRQLDLIQGTGLQKLASQFEEPPTVRSRSNSSDGNETLQGSRSYVQPQQRDLVTQVFHGSYVHPQRLLGSLDNSPQNETQEQEFLQGLRSYVQPQQLQGDMDSPPRNESEEQEFLQVQPQQSSQGIPLESPPLNGKEREFLQGSRSYVCPKKLGRVNLESELRQGVTECSDRGEKLEFLQGSRSYVRPKQRNLNSDSDTQTLRSPDSSSDGFQKSRYYIPSIQKNRRLLRTERGIFKGPKPLRLQRTFLQANQPKQSGCLQEEDIQGSGPYRHPERREEQTPRQNPISETIYSPGDTSSVYSEDVAVHNDTTRPTSFYEYNGMRTAQKTTDNMPRYLKRRRGWVGMIIQDSVPRTLRLDHISAYIAAGENTTLVLVKQPHAERFRTTHLMKRGSEELVDGMNNKRIRV